MVGLGDARKWGDADCLWRVFASVAIAVLRGRINQGRAILDHPKSYECTLCDRLMNLLRR